jgi:hypothetical protein
MSEICATVAKQVQRIQTSFNTVQRQPFMPLKSSGQLTPRTNAREWRKIEISQGTRYPVVSDGF